MLAFPAEEMRGKHVSRGCLVKDKKKMGVRLLCYFSGMLIMTLGVAVSVKSVLGVSPISSVPYTMTVVWGIDLGIAATIFSIAAALLEIPILRKKYKAMALLQIPVSIVFGLFMTRLPDRDYESNKLEVPDIKGYRRYY